MSESTSALVALRDEERAPLARGLDREAVPVDEPDPGGERVDAQGLPGEVEVGERGLHDELDVARCGPGPQQRHRSLGHQGRARHGVEHLAVGRGLGHEQVDDALVDVVQPLGVVVDGVEGAGFAEQRRRRDGDGCAGSGPGSARWRRGCRR